MAPYTRSLVVQRGMSLTFITRTQRVLDELEIEVARNMSVAMGRPLPAFRIRNIARDVVQTVGLIFAAGRVASAVDSHRAPAPDDLERLGLGDVAEMRKPYRA